jgi:hypothetical protein
MEAAAAPNHHTPATVRRGSRSAGGNQGGQDVSAHRTGWHFTGEGNEGPQVQGLQRVLSRRHLSKCMMSNVLRDKVE